MAIHAGVDTRYRFSLLGDLRPTRGNLLFLVEGPEGFGPPRALKLYRRRRSLAQELSSTITQQFLECKSGTSAAARHATEHDLLGTWGRAGFDVPEIIDEEPPAGFGPLVLWMEYCPGEPLSAWLADPERRTRGEELLARAASDIGRRQLLALERQDLRLFHEHATFNHVLVGERGAADAEERLTTIDLEARWLDRADPEGALAAETAGFLRSLWRAAGADADGNTRERRFESWLERFARGHGEPEILARAARHSVGGKSLASRARRARDRNVRGPRGKTWVMQRLLEKTS